MMNKGWMCEACGCEPKTKEEKIKMLDRKEEFLVSKLDKVRKMRDDVKAGNESSDGAAM